MRFVGQIVNYRNNLAYKMRKSNDYQFVPILVKSKINYKFSTQMFEKETKFHTAFVPVVKTQITQVRTFILYVKMTHEKGMYILDMVTLSTAYLKSLKKTFK